MMPMLPAHSALQGQQSYNLDMSLLMAQANHASFVQQLNLQRARHLLQQQSFDNLNAGTRLPSGSRPIAQWHLMLWRADDIHVSTPPPPEDHQPRRGR